MSRAVQLKRVVGTQHKELRRRTKEAIVISEANKSIDFGVAQASLSVGRETKSLVQSFGTTSVVQTGPVAKSNSWYSCPFYGSWYSASTNTQPLARLLWVVGWLAMHTASRPVTRLLVIKVHWVPLKRSKRSLLG